MIVALTPVAGQLDAVRAEQCGLLTSRSYRKPSRCKPLAMCDLRTVGLERWHPALADSVEIPGHTFDNQADDLRPCTGCRVLVILARCLLGWRQFGGSRRNWDPARPGCNGHRRLRQLGDRHRQAAGTN